MNKASLLHRLRLKRIGILLCMFISISLLMHSALGVSNIGISKTVSSSGYQTGSPGVSSNFKIVVTNTGDNPLNSVTVTDLMPKGITYTSATPNPTSWNVNANGTTTLTWNMGAMNAGTSKTIYPRAIRDGLAFGRLSNLAAALGADAMGIVVSNFTSYTITALKPDLKIVNVASPWSGENCTIVAFSISIHNAGNDTFSSIRATDLLPAGLTYISEGAVPQPDFIINNANGSTNLTWSNLGYLAIGATKTIVFSARIDGKALGNLANNIWIKGKPPRDFAYQVVNSSCTTVNALRSGIKVTGSALPASGAPGTDIDFSFNISNSGEVPLGQVNLTNFLPEGIAYVSSIPAASELGETITWAGIGSLAPREYALIHLIGRIDGCKPGAIENRFSVGGTPPAGCHVNDHDAIVVFANRTGLQVNNTPFPESGAFGTNIDFKISIANTGDVELTAIELVDVLPKGLSYSSASINPDSQTTDLNGNTKIAWKNILIGPLDPGESTSINLTALINGDKCGFLQNSVAAYGDPPTGFNISGGHASEIYVLKSAIQVAKTPSLELGAPGTNVDFKIDLTNTGEIAIAAVKLVDLLPKGLCYLSASIEPDSIEDNSNGTRTMIWSDILNQTLQPGSTASVYLRATIDATSFGTLKNNVTAIGRLQSGKEVLNESSAAVNATEPKLSVSGKALPEFGPSGADIVFEINITNSGEADISQINIIDLLPEGLDYVSSDPKGSELKGRVTWPPLSQLARGESSLIKIVARVDGDRLGKLVNKVEVSGRTYQGFNVKGSEVIEVQALTSILSVNKTAEEEEAEPGTNIKFAIIAANEGQCNFTSLEMVDILPQGLSYVDGYIDRFPWKRPDTVRASPDSTTSIIWNNASRLGRMESCRAVVVARVDADAPNEMINVADVTGSAENGKSVTNTSVIEVRKKNPISVSKVASKGDVHPGDEITYSINIINNGGLPLRDIIVSDIFDSRIEFVSAFPMPDAKGIWHFSILYPHSSLLIVLKVKVPKSQIDFSTDQKVDGTGFINIANELSTSCEQYTITNHLQVKAEGYQSAASESITVSSAPGTELKVREHGSGRYSEAEITDFHTENKTINITKSLSAKYMPTTFSLCRNRTENFSSKWHTTFSAKNLITGTSAKESYQYASYIQNHKRLVLDRNGTDFAVKSDFEGMLGMEFGKMPLINKSHGQSATFRSSEDYSGQFSIQQSVEEYGQDVKFDKIAKGKGSINAYRAAGQSQRTFEMGTGDYEIIEKIRTPASFLSKNITFSCLPVSSHPAALNMTMFRRGKEGMWSRPDKSSLIGEEFQDVSWIRKDASFKGLSQMETEVHFSGRSQFRAECEKVIVDLEQAGDFSIHRKLLLAGVSRYDRPHISLTKDGLIRPALINGINATVAEYKIKVLNDGNTALEPVYIKDIFPSGCTFINSSLKPEWVDSSHAKWTLPGLVVGSAITIHLRLKINDDGPNLVNLAEAYGAYGDKWANASNVSSLERSWLGCCKSRISAIKRVHIDSDTPNIAWYTISIRNDANCSAAALVVDYLPQGMQFLNSSVLPSEQSFSQIKWVFPELDRGEARSITYRMQATEDGKFSNLAEVYAISGEGEGDALALATADVVIGQMPMSSTKGQDTSSCTALDEFKVGGEYSIGCFQPMKSQPACFL